MSVSEMWRNAGCNIQPGSMGRDEIRAMGSIRYADGTRVERGDTVEWRGEEWTVIGFDPNNGAVVLRGRTVARADPWETSRRR